MLLAAIGLVLLMACANVANLFLIRAEDRRREVALRAALGAERRDLVRHLLVESLVLGALAGAFGLGLAAAGIRLLIVLGPSNLPRLLEVDISGAELAFTAAISLLASVAFGALPTMRFLRSRRSDRALLAKPLECRDRGAAAPHQRATSLLVICQVSLTLILLVAAALFALSLGNLLRIDPGFRAERVLTFRLSLPEADFPDRARQAAFHQELIDKLETLPGVEAAGLTRCLPLQGWCGGNQVTSPDTTLPPEALQDVASIKPISPGYFRALGIPLRRGRTIERRDHEARTGAAVLSETLAARVFPGADPIGKRIHPTESGPADEQGWYTVVGVVGDVKRERLDEAPADILYLPMLGTDDVALPTLAEVTVAVRSDGEPTAMVPAVRAVVRELSQEIPLADVQPMDEILARASVRVELTATILGLAAASALLLGAIGVFGVVSHGVGRRIPEIGLRIALGASRRGVVLMVLRGGLQVGLAGILVGLAGALAVARFLRSLLYGVSPQNPLILAAVAAVLRGVAALASYLPARRAARIDPVVALKHE
ncbi:MAG TPA: FtsX-like permease family protein [Thermoanaerobaculia bacterium]|nr:FtsX-like permease family protein [Thermoanaerobaculia bacterium]